MKKTWMRCLIVATVGAAAGWVPAVAAQESFTDKVGSAFKKSVDAVTRPFQSDRDPPGEPDPTMLSSPGEPSPDSYVAMARFLEQTGKLELAADQYERALAAAPNHLQALLGYARLRERQGEAGAAIELYRRASKAHPQNGAVANDVGLFFAKRREYAKASELLLHAVELDPNNPRYRANLAAVLIDLDRPADALFHLQAVGPPAIAHYNLAFLLNKKGQREAALFHFSKALEFDPTLEPARHWVARLGPPAPQGMAGAPVANHAPAAAPAQASAPAGLPLTPPARPDPSQLPPAFRAAPGPLSENVAPSDPAARVVALPPVPEEPIRTASRQPTPWAAAPAAPPVQAPVAPLPPSDTSIPQVRLLPPVE